LPFISKKALSSIGSLNELLTKTIADLSKQSSLQHAILASIV
jgi:hypothetical protein